MMTLRIGDLVVPNGCGPWDAGSHYIGKEGTIIVIDNTSIPVSYRVKFDNGAELWYDSDALTTKKQRIYEFYKKVSS